jgi:hypothetical protein
MKKCLSLHLVELGLVAFVLQRAKADGYFGITIGPAYCDPYSEYGGYYPYYPRHYYYYDNPYRYRYWQHHHHWRHWDDE